MRVLLFTGRGGVGTTTAAAATAVRSARRGHRTSLVLADPADGPAMLGLQVSADPVEVEPRLRVAAFDGVAVAERSAESIQELLGGFLAGSGAAPLVPDELTSLPGFVELWTLSELAGRIRDGDDGLVVVDCGRSSDLVRLLALPEQISWYVERVLPRHWRVVHSGESGSTESMMDSLASAFTALADRAVAIRTALDSIVSLTVRQVLAPERSSVEDARRTAARLGLLGRRMDGLILNRMIPPDLGGSSDPWRTAVRAGQDAAVAAARAAFPGLPPRTASYRSAPPDSVTALDELGVEIYGDADPSVLAEGPSSVTAPRIEREPCAEAVGGEEFVWTLPTPYAARDEVSLARVDDELALTAAGVRRLIALPSVLRRCEVLSAAYTSDGLRVRFRPDPALWPKG